MPAAYATSADLAAWLGGEAPADAARQLARASQLLDACVYGTFLIDSQTELPVDAHVAAALRDAACAQVEFWLEVGEEHDIDGGAHRKVSVGGLAYERPARLADRALDVLRNAGLMSAWRTT
jgi:hypothetical protein